LWRAINKHDALGGAGVMLDIYTGEILAMASLPDFDPNAVARSPVKFQANRVTKDTYELGSIFKVFTLAGALDHKVISISDRFDATKPLKIAGYSITDDHPQNRWLTTPEVLLHSSNIASGQIALKMGAENHRSFLQQLGLLDPLSVELNEISSPRYAGRWGDVKTVTASYGHGIAVSQLHAAQASAAILNGGTLIRATLIADDPISKDARSTRVISPETSKVMRELLRLVVLKGTGSKADVPGYRVGGKTGTAEKPSAHGYRKDANMASFLGSFPMDDPRYVVIVTLDEAKGTKDTYGFDGAGWVSAPVVRNVILRSAPILGVEPSDRDVDITVAPLLMAASDRQ
ncbi:MAG: penicillin-binding protein 2, partial [Sphingomonadales bacterium]